MVRTRKRGSAVTPSNTIAAPGIGRTIDPIIVAAKIASKRHDWGVIPEGTGIRRIPAATNSTMPQRRSRLRNPMLSAGSLLFLSEGSDDGCSTQSSFYGATEEPRDVIPSDAACSRVFECADDLALVSISANHPTNRGILKSEGCEKWWKNRKRLQKKRFT